MLPTSSRAESGDAVERGDEPGIAELRLVVFNGGLVDLDLCIELIDGGLLIVAQLAGGGILFDEFGVALEVEFSIVEMRLVVTEGSLRLVELRLIGARIDLREQIAFLDELAFLEVDADQLSRDLAANHRRVQRCDRAQAGQHDRRLMLLDGRRNDGNRLRRGGRRRSIAILPRIEDNPSGQKRDGCDGQSHCPPSARHHSTPCVGASLEPATPLPKIRRAPAGPGDRYFGVAMDFTASIPGSKSENSAWRRASRALDARLVRRVRSTGLVG